jgi:hypothetical protein
MGEIPTMITELKPGQIFCFGSNLAGIHGAGAAKTALQWGAVMGRGQGHSGQTYAIPTKNEHIQTLSLYRIRMFVYIFIDYAIGNPELEFLLTPIGCGLAGYKPEQIAPMFKHAPSNVVLPNEFKEVIKPNQKDTE